MSVKYTHQKILLHISDQESLAETLWGTKRTTIDYKAIIFYNRKITPFYKIYV